MTEAAKQIRLAHGGGGYLADRLLRDLVLKYLPGQPTLMDAATLEIPPSRVAFTTDSYVVSPIFFPGGDLGKLAVFGTCNDLAMIGAEPVGLSLALIIEEGFELDALERIISSIAEACREANTQIVTGDTKVVAKGQADGMYINTAGVGRIHPKAKLGFEHIAAGDKILINGPIGDHGLAIMAQREGLNFDTPIVSDVASLTVLSNQLVSELGPDLRFMRDPTRGGLAGVLVDIAEGANKGLIVHESQIPRNPSTRAAAEILGLELITVANEGKLVAVIEPHCIDQALDICRSNKLAPQAAVIGEITDTIDAGQVVMETTIGAKRIVQKPYGEQLPRIC